MQLRFHRLVLDRDRLELIHRGEEGGEEVVHLQPTVFRTLDYLIQHNHRVVYKEELLEKIWEDRFVTEGSVTRAISVLRKTLASCGARDVIRTVHGAGYRFVALLESSTGGPVPGAPRDRTVETPEVPERRERRAQMAALAGRIEEARRLGMSSRDVAQWLLELADLEICEGEVDSARTTLREAAAIARWHGWGDLFACSAIAHASVLVVANRSEASRLLLEEARESVRDAGLRARVLAALAFVLSPGGEPEECHPLAVQAIELARRTGDDRTLGRVLVCARRALESPGTVRERLALAEEALEVGERLGDPAIRLPALHGCMMDCLELGELDRFARDQERIAALAEHEQYPLWRVLAGMGGTLRLQIAGRFEEGWQQVDALATQVHGFDEFKISVLASGLTVALNHSDPSRYMQRLTRTLSGTNWNAKQTVAVSAMMAPLSCRLGFHDEARKVLSDLVESGFSSLPRDLLWVAAMANLSQAAAVTGHAAAASEIYARLEPHASSIATSGGGCWLGPVHHALGLCAATVGQGERATHHFAASYAFADRIGAAVDRARSGCEWGAQLVDSGRPEAISQGRERLRTALALAETLEMVDVAARARGLLES